MKRIRIIVLVDLSGYSENLIDFAFSLSNIISAKVIFVHQIAAVAPRLADQESRAEIIRTEKEEANSKLWKSNGTFLVLQQGSRSLKDNILRKFIINELVYTGRPNDECCLLFLPCLSTTHSPT